MDNAKNQLVEKLQASTNILVTVSRDPSVDQLASCVGLTLLLNKLGKHATAVFSGEVPSTLEFLEPEQTLEKTTDSLRDFIIALDKTKADKLRYKVEDDMVRIFITPFRVSITDKDLEFSQGDFNVDVVLALGVTRQEDFDAAITAHGRILHDAVVSSISTSGGTELGSINWSEPGSSSLSELVVQLAHSLGEGLLDAQVSTALLTGIVSETERFSNEKTTPQTMSVSAELMAAGANQQLVATQLSQGVQPPTVAPAEQGLQPSTQVQSKTAEPKSAADGTLEIDHDSIEAVLQGIGVHSDDPNLARAAAESQELPEPVEESAAPTEQADAIPKTSRLILQPPSLGGQLTANSETEQLDPANDVFGVPNDPPPTLLNRSTPAVETPSPAPQPVQSTTRQNNPPMTGFTPPPPAWIPATQDNTNQLNDMPLLREVDTGGTLAEIEVSVHDSQVASLDTARDEVMKAINSQQQPLEPVQALGAHPLGDPLRADEITEPTSANPAFSEMLNQVIPPAAATVLVPATPFHPYSEQAAPVAAPTVNDPTAPPPVPPPIPFNFNNPTPPQQ